MRRLLLLVLKAFVSVILLVLALRAVDFPAVRERLFDLSPLWIALVILIMVVQIVAQAVRWRAIVTAVGIVIPLQAAVRISLIAAFFNQTLPSTVGGDAARIWLLTRLKEASWKAATYSVLLDRVVGVFTLALVVVAVLPWTYTYVDSPVGRMAVTVIGFGGVGGGFIFAALSLGQNGWLDKFWPTRHLAAAAGALTGIFRFPREAARIAALSIAIHLLTAVVAWGIARSIDAPLTLLLALCLMPPVVLMATLPISIAGWGVREALMMTAFTFAGLSSDDALVISLVYGAANFFLGACGGLVWIATRDRSDTGLPPESEPVTSGGNRPRSG